MSDALDPFDVLAAVRDLEYRDTVGVRTDAIAGHLERDPAEVGVELSRLARAGQLEHERDPMGSEWWNTTTPGLADLDEHEQTHGRGTEPLL